MKKVLHIYKTYYPDGVGGVQESIREIGLYTRNFGLSHTVFTLSENPHPQELTIDGILIHREKQMGELLSCPIGSLESFRRLKQMATNSDVIVYHYPWPFGDLLSFFICDKPSVVLYHSDIVRQKISGIIYAPLRDIFLKRASLIVATSENYAKSSRILQKYRHKLKIIPLTSVENKYPEDSGIIEKLKLENRKFVLFVGVLRYYKGLDTLVKAAKYINSPVVIAGDGPEWNHLLYLKEQIGAENVLFTGKITDAEKKALYQKAAVFVFPSNTRSEAYGVSLAEAAMYGIPMVSCEIGTGTSFINIDNVTGFVVPPNNYISLSEAINTILQKKILASNMKLKAIKHWTEEMSPEIFGKRWAELILNL